MTAYGYGLCHRPAGIGAVPRGQLIVPSQFKSQIDYTADNVTEFRFGRVFYREPLAPDDVAGFELVEIGPVELTPNCPHEPDDCPWQSWTMTEAAR